MLVKFLNTHKRDIVCEVNNRRVQLRQDNDGTYGHFALKEGKHQIKIHKKTFYSSPLCYLNMFNPIFFIWQLRFLEHRESKKEFVSTTIRFELCDKEPASIVVNKPFTECNIINNIENKCLRDSLVCEHNQDFSQIKKYKKTHIINSVFYMILFNVIGVIDGFSKGDYWETLLFCLLVSLFSISNIIRTHKQYQENSGDGSEENSGDGSVR